MAYINASFTLKPDHNPMIHLRLHAIELARVELVNPGLNFSGSLTTHERLIHPVMF